MIWVELVILLICILVGARLGGIALGTVAGIGLAIFVFIIGLPPGGPPGTVIGMIIAVITALATMQAAGGLDYLVALAERVMRKHPQYITFIAPVVTYLLVFASGTTHVIYALLPVIAEVSRKADIRPERPLSISVIGGFQGVIASPISAATVAMIGLLTAKDVSLPRLLAITIPSTFLGVLIGIFPNLRQEYEVVGSGAIETDQVSMGMAIMIIMLAIAGLIMILFKASPEATLKGTIMRSGMTAVISIVGVSWLGSSFFEGNRIFIVSGISDLILLYPWAFAAGLFILSAMLFSAAATVVILMPVGLALNLPLPFLIAFYPAANGVFFLPTYGTLLAAVSFDQTGTTKIGKYLLNHSFMLPGLVTVVSAIIIALLLGTALAA